MHPSIHLTIWLFIHTSRHWYIYSSTIHPFIHPFIYSSIHPFIRPYINISIHRSIHPSIHSIVRGSHFLGKVIIVLCAFFLKFLNHLFKLCPYFRRNNLFKQSQNFFFLRRATIPILTNKWFPSAYCRRLIWTFWNFRKLTCIFFLILTGYYPLPYYKIIINDTCLNAKTIIRSKIYWK